MTKEELSQIFALNREIEHLREQYRQKRAEYNATFNGNTLSDTVSGSSSEWPYCLHTMTIQGIPDTTGKRKEYREALSETISKLWDAAAKREKELNRLRDYINGVADSEIRMILTLYFVDGMKWREVASSMGPGFSEDAVKQKCSRFFEKK